MSQLSLDETSNFSREGVSGLIADALPVPWTSYKTHSEDRHQHLPTELTLMCCLQFREHVWASCGRGRTTPDGINVSSSCVFLVVCWEMLVKPEYSRDATEYGL